MVAVCELSAGRRHGATFHAESRLSPRHEASNARVPRLESERPPPVRIATSRHTLRAAYRLVYRRYSERGLLRRQPSGLLYSPEFSHGDSRTLVALAETGEVTATATFVGGQAERDFSTSAIIPWRLLPSEDRDRPLAGVTCLAAADCANGPKPLAFFSLARFLFQYAKHRGYDGLVISIHPRQLRFYRRICPIHPLGPAYRQPKLGNALAVACRIDLDRSSLLSQVAPSVLSWFEAPISAYELNRPGISQATDAYLAGCAGNGDYAVLEARLAKPDR